MNQMDSTMLDDRKYMATRWVAHDLDGQHKAYARRFMAMRWVAQKHMTWIDSTRLEMVHGYVMEQHMTWMDSTWLSDRVHVTWMDSTRLCDGIAFDLDGQ